MVTFSVKAGASYIVKLHDVDFRGNPAFVYRLAVSTGPRVITMIPAVGRRGETRIVEFVGYGVATGQTRTGVCQTQGDVSCSSHTKHVSVSVADTVRHACKQLKCLSTTSRRWSFPTQASRWELRFPERSPLRMGVAGTDEWKFRAKKGGGVANRLPIARNRHASRSRTEHSQMPRAKQLASNDDLPGTSDAGLDFKVPADGTYLCRVSRHVRTPARTRSCVQACDLKTAIRVVGASEVERSLGRQGHADRKGCSPRRLPMGKSD